MNQPDHVREVVLLDPECLFLPRAVSKCLGHPNHYEVRLLQISEDAHLGLLALDGTRLEAIRDPEGFHWANPPHRRRFVGEDYYRSQAPLCQLDPLEREDGTYSTHPQRGWRR